jgi:DNA-binding ferritin-like protein (Dps family)
MAKQQLLESLKKIKGVDVSKVQRLLEVHEQRQLAMAELSAIIGQDVTFSEDELYENVADQYAQEIMKDMEKKMAKVFSNG